MRSTRPLKLADLPDFVVAKFRENLGKCERRPPGPGQRTGCLIWGPGGPSPDTYGAFSIDGTTYPAHRLAYVLRHGAIAARKMVLHTCDVKGCVESDHLYAGTAADNARDWHARRDKPERHELLMVTVRIYADDLAAVKLAAAEKRIPWQVELRSLIHKALGPRDLRILGG